MTEQALFKAAQTYVGLPWRTDFDCTALALRVQRELFGRAPVMPPQAQVQRADAVHALSAQLAQRVGHPRTGTAVLFREAMGKCAVRWHLGTVFMRPGRAYEPWVLHSDETRNTQFQPLSELLTQGLDLDGFFEWKPA